MRKENEIEKSEGRGEEDVGVGTCYFGKVWHQHVAVTKEDKCGGRRSRFDEAWKERSVVRIAS